MRNQEAITLLRNFEDLLDFYYGLNEEGKTAKKIMRTDESRPQKHGTGGRAMDLIDGGSGA